MRTMQSSGHDNFWRQLKYQPQKDIMYMVQKHSALLPLRRSNFNLNMIMASNAFNIRSLETTSIGAALDHY